jgi:hypothetical protein
LSKCKNSYVDIQILAADHCRTFKPSLTTSTLCGECLTGYLRPIEELTTARFLAHQHG